MIPSRVVAKKNWADNVAPYRTTVIDNIIAPQEQSITLSVYVVPTRLVFGLLSTVPEVKNVGAVINDITRI